MWSSEYDRWPALFHAQLDMSLSPALSCLLLVDLLFHKVEREPAQHERRVAMTS